MTEPDSYDSVLDSITAEVLTGEAVAGTDTTEAGVPAAEVAELNAAAGGEQPTEEPVAEPQQPETDVQAAAPSPDVAVSAATEPSSLETKLLSRLAELEEKLARAAVPPAPAPEPEPQYQYPTVTAHDFQIDPVGAMRRLGVDPAYVANHMIADARGAETPAEIRAQLGVAPALQQMTNQYNQQIGQLSRQLAEMRQKEVLREIESQARDFLSAPPQEFTHLQRAYKRDPKRVSADIIETIKQDAIARKLSVNDTPLSPGEAAKVIEARLKTYADLLAEEKPAQKTTPAPAAVQKKPPATASNLSGSTPRQAETEESGDWLDKVHSQILAELNIQKD